MSKHQNPLASILDSNAADVSGTVATAAPTASSAPSPTVLETDRWTSRQGQNMAAEWNETGAIPAPDGDNDEQPDTRAAVAADALATCLEYNPERAERPSEKQRADYWNTLLNSPELARVRQHTVARPAVARIAALSFAQEWYKYAAANPPSEQQQQPDGDGSGNDGQNVQDTIARIASTRAALKAAEQAGADAAGLAAGLGLGTETDADAQAIATMYQTVANDATLRAIMETAGRWQRAATALRQSARVDSATGEIVGVTVSQDIANILPTELAILAGAVPQLAALQRAQFADGQLASYRRKMREPAARGPIVLSIDESSSMNGPRIITAKAFALTVAQIAREQKRPFAFHGFAGTDFLRSVSSADSPAALLSWLTRQLGGGTIPHGPLECVPECWPTGRDGQADHIILTDGIMPVSDAMRDSYNAWAKAHDVRTWLIGLGVPELGDMASVATSITVVPSLTPDGLKAVLVSL